MYINLRAPDVEPKKVFAVGNKVCFIGSFPYDQDFGSYIGNFRPDKVWTIEEIHDKHVVLSSHGFGVYKTGDGSAYGCGAIYVSKKYFNQFQEVKDDEVNQCVAQQQAASDRTA